MLRRLVRGADIVPLQNLLDVCEPVQDYERVIQRKHTVVSPLTRAVDAARPDARVGRDFRALVAGNQGEAEIRAKIEGQLRLWVLNHDMLMPITHRSPILREISTLSWDLSRIAALGLRALISPDRPWDEQEKEALAKAKEPRGQLHLVVVSAIKDLLGSG